MSDVNLQITLRTAQARRQMRQAIFKATQTVFEIDIKEQAVRDSPVSEKWPSIPEQRGEPRIDTGANRRSIDTEVTQTEKGTEAKIFTQSGHGGYNEVGTALMPARPYIGPAVLDNVKKIGPETKKLIHG